MSALPGSLLKAQIGRAKLWFVVLLGGAILSAGLMGSCGGTGGASSSAPGAMKAASGSAVVLTYHNDNARSGQMLSESTLTPGSVNSANFGKLFTYDLDGQPYAQPLYVSHVQIAGGTHNVLYVATEHDTVYALEADGMGSTPLWQVSFINPDAGVTTVPCEDISDCTDLAPEIGITSTPVIDGGSGTLYVVARTKELSGGAASYVHRLHALDITAGAEKFGGPVVLDASVAGTADDADGGQVRFDSFRELQRPALLLNNNVVYIGFSSLGEVTPFHGWVLGYDAKALRQAMVFNATPNGSDGGIWQSGGGPATDNGGNIFFVTGNGTFDADSGGKDFGDSFIKLSPSGNVLDFFTPHDQQALSDDDRDLGSGGNLLIDQSGSHPHLAISAGKNGTIYVVDRDNMGHFHGNNDSVVQAIAGAFAGRAGNFSAPVFWQDHVYFGGVHDAIKAFEVKSGGLSTSPTSQSTKTFAYPGATMAISANGSSNGILWAMEMPDSNDRAVLHAYDATNLAKELYTSDQAGGRDTLDAGVKFVVPTIANGKVYVVGQGNIAAFGLLH